MKQEYQYAFKYIFMKANKLFFLILAIGIIFLSGCVAKRKYLESQIQLRYLKNDSAQLAYKVSTLNDSIAGLQQQINELNGNYAQLTSSANATQSQLSESRRSFQEQQQKLQQLQNLLDQQKQKAEELKKKMTDALVGFNASDLSVTQKNGKVYVSLSENLLFPSGSAVVNPQGKEALSKLA